MKFRVICGMSAYHAQAHIRVLHAAGELKLVVFEDARLGKVGRWAKTFGKQSRLQGVGSVKRDSALWEEFLTAERIPFYVVKPRRRTTKKDAELFARITGWTERTNEHGRDAGMFVYGITQSKAQAMIRQHPPL